MKLKFQAEVGNEIGSMEEGEKNIKVDQKDIFA